MIQSLTSIQLQHSSLKSCNGVFYFSCSVPRPRDIKIKILVDTNRKPMRCMGKLLKMRSKQIVFFSFSFSIEHAFLIIWI